MSRASFKSWVGCLVLVGTVACSPPGAEPRFQAVAVFAETSVGGSEESVREGREDDEGGSLEARLEQRRAQRRQQAGDGKDPGPDLGSVQAVALAGRLQADLPARSDRWSWAVEGEATLVLHQTTGGAPDALIYAEAFSPLARSRPAAEARRFLLTVVPELPAARLRTAHDLEAQILPVTQELQRSPREILRALEKSLTATLGRGLGFVPAAAGFSGWKWLGRNESGVLLRVGRSQGHWGPQPELDGETRGVLEDLAQEAPELEDLLWDDPALEVPRSPARLVLASVSTGSGWDQGIHVAILCRRSPRCPVEKDLVRFLDSLRLPEPGVAGGGARPTSSWEILAPQAGLQLDPDTEPRRRAVEAALKRLAPEPKTESKAPESASEREPEFRETDL